MGIFDQMKAAQDMMKNMSPDELRDMMKQAEESKRMIENMVKKAVEEEIQRRDLISREEAQRLFQNQQ
jgi:BMFP domain-containing protein YqiC